MSEVNSPRARGSRDGYACRRILVAESWGAGKSTGADAFPQDLVSIWLVKTELPKSLAGQDRAPPAPIGRTAESRPYFLPYPRVNAIVMPNFARGLVGVTGRFTAWATPNMWVGSVRWQWRWEW